MARGISLGEGLGPKSGADINSGEMVLAGEGEEGDGVELAGADFVFCSARSPSVTGMARNGFSSVVSVFVGAAVSLGEGEAAASILGIVRAWTEL